MHDYEEYSKILTETVGLNALPVGVKFYEEIPNQFSRAEDHRFCQTVMRARKGETLLLTAEDITCPAAALGYILYLI